ncbi:hypothetical protein D7X33_06175 [Butyricicoccus sp. 1XD8-22]|nr:hypothetical protein D7X33_06175 [Butyricicoccus sp. 1XD8-22]
MRWFFEKSKDERVEAELNRIYRIGFYVLLLGIAFDVILQVTSFGAEGSFVGFHVRPVEFAALIVSCVLCLVMMVRRGIGDEGRYAEADRFPHGHYIAFSAIAGAIAGGLQGVLCVPKYMEMAPESWLLVAVFSAVGTFVITAPCIYLIQYGCFRAAKKHREKAAQAIEDDRD